ncbi:MAG: hypothetical protein IKK52_05320 [Alphaproteobacteria bacterium]|nr:hypothetical protein [Alphaproteobacteria bacterium]
MLDKTKFNDNQIENIDPKISLEMWEEERYKYMWEKMLKVEQLKKENQKKTSLRLTKQKFN